MSGSTLRKYGVSATINFQLVQPDGVDFEPAATFAAGDIKIMKDEGAEAKTTNLPTDEGQGYSLVLTATEMQAARIVVYVVDQTATKVWLDTAIAIETYGNASAQHAFDLDTGEQQVDAVRISGSATAADDVEANIGNLDAAVSDAVTTLDSGTAQAGGSNTITLRSGASSVDDYYNNAIVAVVVGTGAGQGAIVEDYTGSTRVAQISTSWATQPDNTSQYKVFPFGAVPGATAPTAGQVADAVLDEMVSGHQTAGSLGAELHLSKAMLANKRVHTVSTGVDQVMDDDGSTVLRTMTPTDGGTDTIDVVPS